MSQSLIDTNQAAELLGRTQRSVVRLIREGKLPYVQRTTGHNVYLLDPDVVLKFRAERDQPKKQAS